jgi:predicted nucleic acid-binding protein
MMTQQIESGYLFDTDATTEYLLGNVSMPAKLRRFSPGTIGVSIVTVAEIFQGWLAGIQRCRTRGDSGICRAYDTLAEAQTDLEGFITVRYTVEAEAIFQSFPPSVKRVGTNDCRIAATAIASGLVVVTRNTRDFAKVPGVQVEDWTGS